MDGTMSIISPGYYRIAISSGHGQTFVEIPNTAFPIKATKAAHRTANGKKEKKTLTSTEPLREGSVDTDLADETEHSGAKAFKTHSGPSNVEKSPTAAKQTLSKMTHSERNSSEYETSGKDESSDIDGRPRPARDSTIKPPMAKKSKPRSSVNSSVKASTIKPPTPSNFKGARSCSFNEIDHEASEDKMEDWEIRPGVVAGSGSDSDGDSETEHGEYFLLAIRISRTFADQNIGPDTAYSSVYITSARAGVKLSGVHFQVIRVAPGSTAPGPDVPYLRVCSVAAGKVRVRVGGNSFSIGAHGMWRIRAGEECTIANRHYSEAVIHVSTINGD